MKNKERRLIKMLGYFLTVYFLFSRSELVLAQDRTGLRTSLSADIVGEFSGRSDSVSSDQVTPRSIDLIFYAPIDHLFDGTLSLAAHREGGTSLLELHEVYIGSDRLVPGLKFRIGQFFLGIGRLNRFHQHEWPFISTPIVHSRFFDDEGLLDSGLEISYLIPSSIYLDITIGVTNGFVFGHSHDAGKKPNMPMHYFHLLSFFEAAGIGFQPGYSFLKLSPADGSMLKISGIELTGKLNSGKTRTFLLQSESWQQSRRPKSGDLEISTGAYIYPQFGLKSGFEFGIRYDYLTINTKKNALGEHLSNSEYAIVPTVSYRPSEFSNWRLAYRFESTNLDGNTSKTNQIAELQTTYILGAHPSHDF